MSTIHPLDEPAAHGSGQREAQVARPPALQLHHWRLGDIAEGISRIPPARIALALVLTLYDALALRLMLDSGFGAKSDWAPELQAAFEPVTKKHRLSRKPPTPIAD